jgi:hypothetical protein
MINKLKLFTLFLFVGLTLATPQLSYGSDESRNEDVEGPMTALPLELTSDIVKRAAIEQALNDESTENLALVCKEWYWIIEEESQVDKDLWKVLNGIKTPEDEVIYQIFRNMELIYRPDPNSNEGMIRLPIPMGHNPFKYTFDLSSCGDKDRYVVITNDLERFFTIGGENEYTLVICFAMRSWINKNIGSLSAPFNTILTSWDAEQAPVGIFSRWGNWTSEDGFDYLTDQPFHQLSEVSMCENWEKRGVKAGGQRLIPMLRGTLIFSQLIRFHVYLGNQR